MRFGGSRRGSRVRRATLGALIAVVAASASMFSAGSADATPAPGTIELSANGTIWSTSLVGGLFDSFQGAVPGDSVTKSFWVRNPQSVPVTMKTMALDVTTTTSEFESSITVDGEAGGRSLPAPVPLSALSNCATLVPDLVLAGNATVKVSITLAMLDVSTNVAQSSQGGFNVLLTMQDNAAGAPVTSCGGSIPGGGTGGGGHHHPKPSQNGGSHPASPITAALGNPLAFTGIEIGVPLFLGGALLALGFLFLIARRRRREQKDS
jgi:LPXTG-motif cell wall-anchored protein